MTKKWGLVNGNLGWGNEPSEYIEAITILENECDKMENEAYEEQNQKMKSDAQQSKMRKK